MASLVALAAAGCKGEEAYRARDAAAFGVGGNGLVTGTGGTGTGGAGMAGQGGSVGTGGVAGAGNKGGGGGTAGQGGGGTGGQPAGMFGDRCQGTGTANCKQGTCLHGFCCTVDCSGTCQTCDSLGTGCTSVMPGQDLRGDCPDMGASSCASNGTGCNGSGACNLYATNVVCDSTAMCSGTGSVIPNSVCNGAGRCNPNAPVSCNGFQCQSTACLTTCTDGTACVAGGFCGAGTCVGATPNLAGNGDAEYGTTDGWSAILNAGVSATNLVPAHGGTYSIEATGRTAVFQGPGYYIPTGLGQYNISFWAMQNDYAVEDPNATVPAPPAGLLQLRLICATAPNPYYEGFIQVSMPQGVWVNFSTTIDTSDNKTYLTGSDCFPNGLSGSLPGAVKSAVVLLNESSNDTRFPNFYIDDLVVTATNVPNLVGNPNFEAGLVDGWAVANNGTPPATLGVSTTQFNTQKKSLWLQKRPLWNTAIRYALPIGAANYVVTFYVMQLGLTSHHLQLWAAYSCLGDPANSVRQKAITQTAALATGNWAALSSTAVAFPPSDAPKGCKLTGAAFWVTQAEQGTCGTGTGQVECPDLFLDDATIALTTTPPTD